jgi:hypothetical protein
LDRRSHRFSSIGEVTEVGEVSRCEEEVECHAGTESNNNNNNGEKVSQCSRVWERGTISIQLMDDVGSGKEERKKQKKKKKKWVG